MCGRYTVTDLADLAKFIVYVNRAPFFAPRFNLAPTQPAPVLILENQKPTLKMLRWGLIPAWAKDESIGSHNINARSESLSEKPTFRSALKKRRCLIPADSFYEWNQTKKPKQPYRIMLKTGHVFCFAGLWERWVRPPSSDQPDTDLDEPPPSQVVESFTIITRPANPTLKPLHDRMPVILSPGTYRWWLEDEPGTDSYMTALNHQFEEELKIYPVSTLVNNAKNDSPEMIEPVKIGRGCLDED